MRFTFVAPLWESESTASWFFVTVPVELGADLRELPARGFGSIRVEANVGTTTWATSVFPDSQRDSYLLPVKKSVRLAEGLEPGDDVEVSMDLLEFD